MLNIRRNLSIALSNLTVLCFVALSAHADLIRITPTGVAVDEQSITDPVPIGADGFRMSYWSQGNAGKTILDPLLIIFATPLGENAAAPGLAFNASDPKFDPPPLVDLGGTTTRFRRSWDTTTGDAGQFDATSPDNVYNAMGLWPDGVNSQNYSNWTETSGLEAWDLWVYAVTFDPNSFTRGDWVEFSTRNLPSSSFVIGYGCTAMNFLSTNCRNEGNAQSTPYTFAGYVVPEPGTLPLLGVGLLGLGLVRRRKLVA